MSRDFNGNEANHFDIVDNASLSITGTALTILCWVRPDAFGINGSLVSKRDDALSTFAYQLSVFSSGEVYAAVGDGASSFDDAQSATALSTGVWQQAGLRKNGTGAGAIAAIRDGTIDGTDTSNVSIGDTGATLRVGADGSAFWSTLDARIAEVGIWAAALSDAEIMAVYKGLSPLLVRPQSLRAYWPLLGTGSTEKDYSGNGNHLTHQGTVPAGASHPPVMPFMLPLGGIGIPTYTPANVDSATVYLDLQPSSVQEFHGVDSASVYLNLQSSGVDIKEVLDSATVYLDLQVLGGECHSTFSALQFGEGEADLRWTSASDFTRWFAQESLRWSAGEVSVEGIHC